MRKTYPVKIRRHVYEEAEMGIEADNPKNALVLAGMIAPNIRPDQWTKVCVDIQPEIIEELNGGSRGRG